MAVRRTPLTFFLALSVLLNFALIGTLVLRSPQFRSEPGLVAAEVRGSPEGEHLILTFATAMTSTPGSTPETVPVTIDSPFEGTAEWLDARTLIYSPRRELPRGYVFTVRDAAGALDLAGTPLSGGALLTVSTPPPEVLRLGAPLRVDEVCTELTLHFSGAIPVDDVKEHIRVRDMAANGALSFETTTRQPSFVHVLRVSHPNSTKRFQVACSPGLRAEGGQIGSEQAFISEVARPAALEVTQLTGIQRWGELGLEFYCSESVSLDQLQNHVSVQPAVKFEVREYHIGRYWLKGDFEPRTLYRVRFRKGLRSGIGNVLEQDVTLATVTRNRRPYVGFATQGLLMPSQNSRTVPLKVVNADKVALTAWEIFPNNYLRFVQQGQWKADELGRPLATLEYEPSMPANQEQVVNLDLSKLLGDRRSGVFVVEARDLGSQSGYYYWRRQNRCRTVVLTSFAIGAVVTQDEITAWALDLSTGKPAPDCRIEVVSRKNQSLGVGRTGANGFAHIRLESTDETGSPQLLVGYRGREVSFLELDGGNRAATAALEPGGRPLPAAGYEALTYFERGICRPGETVHASVVLRDADLLAAARVPVEMSLYDPRGNLVERVVRGTNTNGFLTRPFAVPPGSPTGRYRLSVGMPGKPETVWGWTSIKVGSYIPDRMRVELRTDKDRYQGGESLNATVNVIYYFGTPVADAKTRLQIEYSDAAFRPKGFEEFTFGDSERDCASRNRQTATALTNDDGVLTAKIDLNPPAQPRAALNAHVSAQVTPPQGRTVTASEIVDVHAYPHYLGVRQAWDSTGDAAPPELLFDVVCLTPDGEPQDLDKPVRADLNRIEWIYVLREKDDGTLRREWVREVIAVDARDVELDARGRARLAVPNPGSGLYMLHLSGPQAGVRTTLRFWYSQGDGSAARSPQADHIQLESDREAYAPGDTAEVRFEVPCAGTALLVAGDQRARTLRCLELNAGSHRHAVPIPADTPLGSYFLALTFVPHPATLSNPDSPVAPRYAGVARLDLERDRNRIAVDVRLPEQARPGTRMPVEVALTREEQATAGTVHLLAVDEGVLALTAHTYPDPYEFFYGPRSFPFTLYDPCMHLYPEMAGRFPLISPEGGGGAGRLSELPLDKSRAAVVLTTVVEVDASGRARTTLDVPEFSGSLRFLALAVAPTATGRATADLRVRHPVTVEVHAPRVAAPGDRFVVSATAFNHEADPVRFRGMTAQGPISMERIEGDYPPVPSGERWSVKILCETDPKRTGVVDFRALFGADDLEIAGTARTEIRAAALPTFRSGLEVVQRGKTVTFFEDPGFVQGSERFLLHVDPSLRVEAAAAAGYLLEYRYGCLEQTLSRAMPSLCLPDLYDLNSEQDTSGLRQQVGLGLRRLYQLERPHGGFSMWRHGRETWVAGSLYAAHFVLEAEAQGIPVDARFRQRIADYLTRVADRRIPPGHDADWGYALYLAAMAGRPENGLALGAAEDANLDSWPRLLAGLALVRGGRAANGARAVHAIPVEDYLHGGGHNDFDSLPRRTALALALFLDTMPDAHQCHRLLEDLRRQRNRNGHWGNTQANAMAVLALSKWQQHHGQAKNSQARVATPGEVLITDPNQPLVLRSPQIGPKATVAGLGPGPVYAAWQASGVPVTPPAIDISRGLEISRVYRTEDGKEATRFQRGDLVRVQLTIRSAEPRRHLVVADLLPGGLEIEDQSLATRWTGTDTTHGLATTVVDKLHDRLVLGCHLYGRHGKTPRVGTFEYTARAAVEGTYRVPRVAVEMMYAPEIRAESGGPGTLVIAGEEP